jgi:HSP20 family protein
MLTRWQPSVLTQWEPFGSMLRDMGRLQGEFARLFDAFGGDSRTWPVLTGAYPALNIWEDDANVYLETELPGMALEDLEIYVTGGDQLTLKGERKQPAVENGTWHRQERGFGSFERVLMLPVSVDASKVEARLENGVLTVRMAKSPAAKPRTIPVKAE